MFLIAPNICRFVIMNRCFRIPVRISNKYFHSEINIHKSCKKSLLEKSLSSSLPISRILNTRYVFVSSDTNLNVQTKRYYSKKKGSKRNLEEEEESATDEEYDDDDDYESEDYAILQDNVVKRNVPSMRIDTITKGFLGITKKKVEKCFYANKIRLNGEPVMKKALTVSVGDEIDVIKGFSPENSKFIIVDRIILKGIGKVTATGSYPLTMEVFKSLTSENYEKPWSPSSMGDAEV